MTAHATVTQTVRAPAARVFALVHDYPRRLEWDTLLRRAEVVGGGAPGKGVETVCTARRALGGFAFRTRYVTFTPPADGVTGLAAVVLVAPVLVFRTWAASIRHRDHGDGTSEVTYTLTFTCRPGPLARVVEPVAAAAFRLETAKRLRALDAFLASPDQPAG